MVNRTRKIVLRVPVTPEERKLIEQKMSLLHTKNFSAYDFQNHFQQIWHR